MGLEIIDPAQTAAPRQKRDKQYNAENQTNVETVGHTHGEELGSMHLTNFWTMWWRHGRYRVPDCTRTLLSGVFGSLVK